MSVSTLLNGILDINVKKITTNEVSSNGGNILIDGTTTFVGNNHIGEAIIPNGDSEIEVPFVGMNNDAVILLTSRNTVSNLWVEADTDKFTIFTDTTVGADTRVNYFILKAN
jgi:hypothetical protein